MPIPSPYCVRQPTAVYLSLPPWKFGRSGLRVLRRFEENHSAGDIKNILETTRKSAGGSFPLDRVEAGESAGSSPRNKCLISI